MLYTKIQSQRFLSTEEEDFKAFLSYLDMATIMFNGAEPFKQIANIPSFDRRPDVKSGENWSSGFLE